MSGTRIISAACAFSALIVPAAHAQAGWSGEGALSAGRTTGNTETTDAGIALKAQVESGRFINRGELTFDYADQDGRESKNRAYGAYQLDRRVGERLNVFFRTSYERDQFSGFNSRGFAGAGLSYDLLGDGPTTWSLKAAPGWRFDDIEPAPATDTTPAVVGRRETSFAAVFGSGLKHEFNEAVTLSNDTEVIYADVSTATMNLAALTAKLTERFSGRFSFEARYESDPPAGRERANTTTRFSLVYGF